MVTVTTIVEVAAPPTLVRSVFLDFPSIPRWHTGHFKSITVLESAAFKPGANPSTTGSTGEDLIAGDKIRIGLADGMSFKAVVVENTPQRFAWRGGWSHVMVGEHSFQFDASNSTPGGTKLTHAESFTGGLVSMCRPFMGNDEERKSPGFEKFNADLKRRAEDQGKGMNK